MSRTRKFQLYPHPASRLVQDVSDQIACLHTCFIHVWIKHYSRTGYSCRALSDDYPSAWADGRIPCSSDPQLQQQLFLLYSELVTAPYIGTYVYALPCPWSSIEPYGSNPTM